MQRVIIFGASLGGERALRALPRGRKVVAFSDNDRKKHGTTFHGRPVIAPEQIQHTPHDRVLIASTYYPEIFNQLVDLSVPVDRIDVLEPEILNGTDEPTRTVYGLLAAAVVIVAFAIYGLVRLIFG